MIDHYESPQNVGSFKADRKDVGTGGKPCCLLIRSRPTEPAPPRPHPFQHVQMILGAANDTFAMSPGLVGAPACGDVMKLQIKVKDGKIEEAVFKVRRRKLALRLLLMTVDSERFPRGECMPLCSCRQGLCKALWSYLAVIGADFRVRLSDRIVICCNRVGQGHGA